MTRRDLLQRLLGATALTAAGLVVPARRTYVFLTNNPLARIDCDVPLRHAWGGIRVDPSHAATRPAFLALMLANRRYLYDVDPDVAPDRTLVFS